NPKPSSISLRSAAGRRVLSKSLAMAALSGAPQGGATVANACLKDSARPCAPLDERGSRRHVAAMPDGPAIERLVIFGATGDLAARMLIPSLYFLDADNLLPKDLKILGSARTDMEREKFVEYVHELLKKRPEGLDDAAWARFSERLDYRSADVTNAKGMKGVAEHVGDKPTVFYLALSPSIYGAVCKTLDEAGLACGECRIVMEKPLGHDLASSEAINAEVASVFEESRVFRIDHYLGKETVQNLLALRFANTLFEPL